ncbi:acyl-CoA dehydrogenase [Paraburkholderia rhizosphaerae]|uniref:Alkylation response protein AidB-like acyl-CoA dehydrogenase n=1 Tax=Paraburkholderia rhizosphaerae TaxID=480658 RepID=A0A4R8L9G7_9BURK|nr:acyl-CoA dehydrogenase [Paraburkholderia rhizosphaerae]TDY39035.1 alkylation response protein AidB-like acyl-CoA dehydrogenase [Paraburkholderia rhizosphaerae]
MSDIVNDALSEALRREPDEHVNHDERHAPTLQRALEQQLAALRFKSDAPRSRGAALEALCARGLDRLPLPGRGRTVQRWSALAAVAACDLSLVKLYEGHTDALAILAELHAPQLAAPGRRWGVWAAEPPHQKVIAAPEDSGTALRLEGVKPWCSGAAQLTHALVTVSRYGEPVLAAVDLAQPSIHLSDGGWHAVGMAATGTCEVRFDGALARQIGEPAAYLARPGFWHGGAGIAACWYGCAVELAAALRAYLMRRAQPHACAHLGAADAQLAAARALLRETAGWIDTYPRADAALRAMRVRIAVEQAASAILTHVTRALGAAPLCSDAHFARAAADLPVFLRQSHAERDEADLGSALRDGPDPLACEPDALWRLAC